MHTSLTCGSLFLEGLLSFFSPCVLPLIPLYLGYLTKDAKKIDANGNEAYSRKKTFFFTFFFILGILFVYVLAGIGTGIFHDFFIDHKLLLEMIGGVLLLILGLMGLHVIRIPFLENVHQKQFHLEGKMTGIKALFLGFFFSFAWSPCTGPLLAQAIVLASSASDKWTGWLYIASYACGFIVVFLLLGFFTEEVLNLLKKYRWVAKYTGIIASLLVLASGGYMLYQAYQEYHALSLNTQEKQETTGKMSIEDMDFSLTDYEGNLHTLSEYKGKTIVLNFFGTWCYYCNQEFPSLQEIQESDPDTKILLVATPNVNGEGDASYIHQYLNERGYTMDVLFDNDLSVTKQFDVSGYPCSFIIRPNGEYMGYIPGYIDHESVVEILNESRK